MWLLNDIFLTVFFLLFTQKYNMWDALRNLVRFVQINNVKSTLWGVLLLVKRLY